MPSDKTRYLITWFFESFIQEIFPIESSQKTVSGHSLKLVSSIMDSLMEFNGLPSDIEQNSR